MLLYKTTQLKSSIPVFLSTEKTTEQSGPYRRGLRLAAGTLAATARNRLGKGPRY